MLQRELAEHKCTAERIEVWQRGVDTVRFNPSYRCDAMRAELSDGHPEAPLLVHVGRLGAGMHPHLYIFACLFHMHADMQAHVTAKCMLQSWVWPPGSRIYASSVDLHQCTTPTLCTSLNADGSPLQPALPGTYWHVLQCIVSLTS